MTTFSFLIISTFLGVLSCSYIWWSFGHVLLGWVGFLFIVVYIRTEVTTTNYGILQYFDGVLQLYFQF